MQPIKAAIESLHAKDQCPRLHVDVTHPDAVCPDFVRDKWKERLIIDLDPSYPLELAFTEIGVEADLSFGGYVTRCVFPWAAIYVVADRGSGRGQVFRTNIPASLRHEFGVAPEPSIDPELTAVRDDPNAPKGSRRRKRRGQPTAEPREGVRAVEDIPEDAEDEAAEAEAEGEGEGEAPGEAKPSEADAAKARRSAFRVIEGGG